MDQKLLNSLIRVNMRHRNLSSCPIPQSGFFFEPDTGKLLLPQNLSKVVPPRKFKWDTALECHIFEESVPQ